MEPLFNFSFLDIWNKMEMRVLRTGVKMAVKGIASANAKEKMQATATVTPEIVALMNKAQNGDSDAQYDLGKYYVENGQICKAVIWFMESARQGNEFAVEMLDILGGE